jgi:hypothetical protein
MKYLCYMVYNTAYNIAYTVIIPNGQQICQSVFLMTGYAIMFKLPLQRFFFGLYSTICVAARAAWTRTEGPLKHSIHSGSWPVLYQACLSNTMGAHSIHRTLIERPTQAMDTAKFMVFAPLHWPILLLWTVYIVIKAPYSTLNGTPSLSNT